MFDKILAIFNSYGNNEFKLFLELKTTGYNSEFMVKENQISQSVEELQKLINRIINLQSFT